jgi:hypothetical protein
MPTPLRADKLGRRSFVSGISIRSVKLPRYTTEWLLIGVIALGAICLVRLSHEQTPLKAEYDRLREISGDLAITDPAQLHFRALRTDDPLHFAWRVYLPANYPLVLRETGGGFSSSGVSQPHEFIARLRIREGERGDLQAFTSFYGGSSLMSLGDKSLADFVRGRERELEVEQLAADGPVTISPTQAATLLKIRLSEKLVADAEAKLKPAVLKRHMPVFYELKLQPPGAVP